MAEKTPQEVDEQALRLLREGYRAFGLGAPESVLRLFDQDAPGDEAGWTVRDVTSTTRYHPREVVADDLFGSIPPHWEVISVDPIRFDGRADHVVVVGHIKCRPRGSWDVMSVPFAHIWTVVRGKIVRVLSYLDGIEIERPTQSVA